MTHILALCCCYRNSNRAIGGSHPELGEFMRGPAPGGGGTAIALGLALSRRAARDCEGGSGEAICDQDCDRACEPASEAGGDQGTQTPESMARDTRNNRLKNLRLQLNVTPSTLNLRSAGTGIHLALDVPARDTADWEINSVDVEAVSFVITKQTRKWISKRRVV